MRRLLRSASDTGFRGAEPISRYEVRAGSAAAWLDVGTVTQWTHAGAPARTLTVGTPTATTALTDRVDLAVPPAVATPGEPRVYRVRAVSAAGTGPQSDEASGARAVGAPAYRWEWSTTSGGAYAAVPGADTRAASDTAIPPGSSRWYRARVTALGAPEAISAAVEGTREAETSLGIVCTATSDCDAGQWCPTDSPYRRCAPRPSFGGVALPFQFVPTTPPEGFVMGSPNNETGRHQNETRVTVHLAQNLYVQRTTVTQGQWRAVVQAWNARPAAQRTLSGFAGPTPAFATSPAYYARPPNALCTVDDCPLESVSWWDAVVFANVLSRLEGLDACYVLEGCEAGEGVGNVGGGCTSTGSFCRTGNFTCSDVTFAGPSCSGYRLPTEAEWEWSARAGTTTTTYGGNLVSVTGTECWTLTGGSGFDSGDELAGLAWFRCNALSRPQPVGQKPPNPWGLHDMLGNMAQMTWNWYATSNAGGTNPLGPDTGLNRVHRGQSWGAEANRVRAAIRSLRGPVDRIGTMGFRLVRTAP